MVASGVTMPQQCTDLFNKHKYNNVYDFIIYRLSDDFKTFVTAHAPEAGTYKTVKSFSPEVNDACGPGSPDRYKYFVQLLTEDNKCGFGIYIFEYKKKEQGLVNPLYHLSWIPESTGIRSKMVYSTSKDELKKKLEVGEKSKHFTELKDFDYRSLIQEISSGTAEL